MAAADTVTPVMHTWGEGRRKRRRERGRVDSALHCARIGKIFKRLVWQQDGNYTDDGQNYRGLLILVSAAGDKAGLQRHQEEKQ